MQTRECPRKPYDEVVSKFIREQIRQGSFTDSEDRRYVNALVWIEWDAIDFGQSNASGIVAFGHAVCRWRYAAKFPTGFDRVRQELGYSTREDLTWNRESDADPAERQQLARRHAEEWRAVQQGNYRDQPQQEPLGRGGRRRPFARFRFPIIPYDAVQSEFIRDEIQSGSFDDLDHRRYVNQLVWTEWYATGGREAVYPGRLGPAVTNWKLAAKDPQAFDIVRREVDTVTLDDIEPVDW